MPPGLEDLLPPDCRDRFKPVRLLGTGGFGAVFLVEQPSLGRVAVVKILHSEALRDPQQVERFKAEARLTASLSHPNIVKVYDFGADRGTPWIAYEYLAGQTLRQAQQAGDLTPAGVVRACLSVAQALSVAHEAKILHRDLKPENVIAAEGDIWKLADFGIAKWTSGPIAKTQTGIILGTPEYVAPELIKGEPASPGSDLYALGIMLFELLTGKPPFTSPNLMDIIQDHLNKPAPQLRTIWPECPRCLGPVVDRMLAKSPDERFRSMSELIPELLDCLEAIEPTAIFKTKALAPGPGRPAVAAETRRVQRDAGPGSDHRSPPRCSRTASKWRWIIGMGLLACGLPAFIYLGAGGKPPDHGRSPAPSAHPSAASTVTPRTGSPLATQDQRTFEEQIQKAVELDRRFRVTFKLLNLSGADVLSPELAQAGNPKELLPILLELKTVLWRLIRRADSEQVRGPRWLRIESVQRRLLDDLSQADRGFLQRDTTDICEFLLTLVDGDQIGAATKASWDSCRKCLLAALRARVDPTARRSLKTARYLAAEALRAMKLVADLDEDSCLDRNHPDVVAAKIRFLDDARVCWRVMSDRRKTEFRGDGPLPESQEPTHELRHVAPDHERSGLASWRKLAKSRRDASSGCSTSGLWRSWTLPASRRWRVTLASI
ncbi:MAG: serine/threonine protein kinase [Candidatus Riflebacteria bacterium]|nr:serine/threonine protein kinase [Candidatus Riflebacteria bacterium]